MNLAVITNAKLWVKALPNITFLMIGDIANVIVDCGDSDRLPIITAAVWIVLFLR